MIKTFRGFLLPRTDRTSDGIRVMDLVTNEPLDIHLLVFVYVTLFDEEEGTPRYCSSVFLEPVIPWTSIEYL